MLLFQRLIFVFTLLIVSVTASHASIFGGADDEPLDVDQAFKFSALQQSDSQVLLNWDIAERYYLYQNRIEISLPEGIELISRTDSKTDTKDDPVFGKVEVFHNVARVELQLARKDAQIPAEATVNLSYQGCWEGGICYPPVSAQFSLTNLAVKSALVAKQTVQSAPVAASEQDIYFATFANSSLAALLGIFFLAGLALSLTPCVFPMIPILSGIIAGQGHRANTRHGFTLSVIYVLAMALTYTIAGVIAGLFGANLQAALQAPVVIVIFSLIFVALSFSMFGYYELQMPSSVQTWLTRNSDKQQGGTYAGVAIMGFLSALIVGPCMAAPLAGALIYIGQTGDPVLGGAALFVMSLGMGVPLILIGTSAAKLMPRAGGWMETVKAGFGVMLLLMAVWMLDRIVPVQVTMGLVALVLIVTAVFMGVLEFHAPEVHSMRKVGKGVGIIFLIYGASLAVGVFAGSSSLLYPLKGVIGSAAVAEDKLQFNTVTTVADLDSQLAEAKAQQRAVMLDFYADWCVSCKELDYVTFADQEVRDRLGQMRLIKVDVTANDEESAKLNKRFEVLGPPTLIFYDGQGIYHKELTLVGVPQPEQLLTMLNRL